MASDADQICPRLREGGRVTTEARAMISGLRAIVGRRHVLTGESRVRPYARGYRGSSGPVVAVVRPATLVEQWHVLQLCVRSGHIVIVQAANTGLTGGSTPDGVYDRGVVIVSTLRIASIHLLRGGSQIVCLAGATLYQLERRLAAVGREPHSVIGSSCIGASVVGGICNNSGGALVQRGPAYTEYALFARIDETGAIELHNHLGIRLQGSPEQILRTVERGQFADGDVLDDDRAACARDYPDKVRDVEAATPARFNADPSRLFEASGSAGKIMVFAVRLDTFPTEPESATFYIGANDAAVLATLRRRMLTELCTLPVSAEYIHRDAFDVAEAYGKDVFLAIRHLGTDRLPLFFAARNRIDAVARRLRFLPPNLSDRTLQRLSRLFPSHLPQRMTAFRNRYLHHLIVKTSGAGIAETRGLLGSMFPGDDGDMFECTPGEAGAAFLHRFAVAGAAVRYRATHQASVGDILAFDIALPRNATSWSERLPPEISGSIEKALYYGHFLCHVFHQDYVLKKGADVGSVKQAMQELLDERGAEYPAEHNVGHSYAAKPPLVDHYRRLDPGNHMNPGIGLTSRDRDWTSSTHG